MPCTVLHLPWLALAPKVPTGQGKVVVVQSKAHTPIARRLSYPPLDAWTVTTGFAVQKPKGTPSSAVALSGVMSPQTSLATARAYVPCRGAMPWCVCRQPPDQPPSPQVPACGAAPGGAAWCTTTCRVQGHTKREAVVFLRGPRWSLCLVQDAVGVRS